MEYCECRTKDTRKTAARNLWDFSAEDYSRCTEIIQKAPQCAIQRVINLYQMTHVIINHVGGFPAPQLHCCNLPFPLFRLWGSLSFMVSCWKRFYSSANNLAIVEKVLFWAADLQVFWQSETTQCVLVPGKQWLLVAILSFSVSGLQDSCGAPAVTMGGLRVRTLVLLWEGRWKLGRIAEMFIVFRRWRK